MLVNISGKKKEFLKAKLDELEIQMYERLV
jgi:hypothetical protein